MTDPKPPLAIYHGGCRDGFAAAWCVRRHNRDAVLYPAAYGTMPPLELAIGRQVYVVDFSYKRHEMLALAAVCELTVFDHHKTAEAELAGLAEQLDRLGLVHGRIVFDMERSGAGIAWDELHGRMAAHMIVGAETPTLAAEWRCIECSGACLRHHTCGLAHHHALTCAARAPWLIRYVEDRDLWRHLLPASEEVNAYLSSQPYGRPEDIAAWDRMVDLGLEIAVAEGAVVLRAIKQYAEAACANAVRRSIGLPDGAIGMVWSVNAIQHSISEVLHRLLELNPQATYVHGWWQRADGMVSNSLRSRGECDVSAIAKTFGGGGHKNAAGFQTTAAELLARFPICVEDGE